MNHALVVGGTGMLADVSLWLVKHGFHVSVIGRNPEKMDKLINKAGKPEAITPVFVDYKDKSTLRREIIKVLQTNGPIDLVVAWIHSNGKDALPIIASEITSTKQQWKLFHVLGSSTNLLDTINKVKIPDGCHYHQIQLGFVIENGYSRWLTHKEISNGVIESIKQNKSVQIVGTIDPWEKRP